MSDDPAKSRYMILSLIRIGALMVLLFGIAIARGIVDLPYGLGVALAVGGLLAFYFGPRQLARRWKSPE